MFYIIVLEVGVEDFYLYKVFVFNLILKLFTGEIYIIYAEVNNC